MSTSKSSLDLSQRCHALIAAMPAPTRGMETRGSSGAVTDIAFD